MHLYPNLESVPGKIIYLGQTDSSLVAAYTANLDLLLRVAEKKPKFEDIQATDISVNEISTLFCSSLFNK